MISRSARLGNHIILVDFELLVHYIMEQGYHGSLGGHPSILQAKWHDIIGLNSPISGERYFGFVFLSHLDLIITRELVHKGEEHVDRSVINLGINMW